MYGSRIIGRALNAAEPSDTLDLLVGHFFDPEPDHVTKTYEVVIGLIEAEELDILVAVWAKWIGPRYGERLLHLIVNHGTVAFLSRSLRHGLIFTAMLFMKDHTNATPLNYAVSMNYYEKARVLLEAGAPSRCIDVYGRLLMHTRCPFDAATNLDMAVLVMTVQGRSFPDRHDEGCCRGTAKSEYLQVCGREIETRRKNRTRAYLPFLFHLKRCMSGGIRIVYTQIVLPMLEFLWRHHGYDPCWKEK